MAKKDINSLETTKDVKEYFAGSYTQAKRMHEIISILTFVGLEAYLGLLVISTIRELNALHVLTTFVFGIVASDFISGIVHWCADTWGDMSWPIVGQSFIRSFREHHVDMQAMCRHDVLETNGDNCFIVLPAPAFGIWWYLGSPNAGLVPVFCFAFSMFISITNQIHKWSHEISPLFWVRMLQSMWIILPKKHHGLHHRGAHDDYYCITTGWLNTPLSMLNFWRISETIVSALTGLKPRSDDQYWLNKVNRLKKKNAEKEQQQQ